MPSAKIALCGEAWGAEEEKLKHPFVGSAGRELVSMLWEAKVFPEKPPFWTFWKNGSPVPEALRDFWLTQDTVSLHNVFNLRPKNNDITTLCTPKSGDTSGLPPIQSGKYVKAEFLSELSRLGRELVEVRPNLIVALGNVPSWALLRRSGGISKSRGTVECETLTGQGFKVLPTYHPAAILREWSNRPVTVLDFCKARRESAFPEIRRPEREIWIDPTLADLEEFHARYILPCRLLSFDIETSGNQITCLGFAPSPARALVIPFVDPRRADRSYWSTLGEELRAWDFVRRVLGSPIPKLAQNGLYDTQFLWRSYGIRTVNMVHDTMLLHHALQPESQKGLGFLGSVYTSEPAWKLMRTQTVKRDE